jgi:tellurite resistance protein
MGTAPTSVDPSGAPWIEDPGAELFTRLCEDELDALVETMALVALADGSYSAPERARFARNVAELTGGRMTDERIDGVVAAVAASLRRDGLEACGLALRQRLVSRELRSVALVLASDMAAADGILHPSERSLLLALADAFQMPPEHTREVLDGFR